MLARLFSRSRAPSAAAPSSSKSALPGKIVLPEVFLKQQQTVDRENSKSISKKQEKKAKQSMEKLEDKLTALGKLAGFTKKKEESKVVVDAKPADQTSDQSKAAAPTTTNNNKWKKGTGYGHSSSSYSWNVDSFQKAAGDVPLTELCNQVSELLKESELAPELLAHLRQTCLVPFLAQQLRNDSLVDMERHEQLYLAVFSVCKRLSEVGLVDLLVDPLDKKAQEEERKELGPCLFTLLSGIKKQAETVEAKQQILLEKMKAKAAAPAPPAAPTAVVNGKPAKKSKSASVVLPTIPSFNDREDSFARLVLNRLADIDTKVFEAYPHFRPQPPKPAVFEVKIAQDEDLEKEAASKVLADQMDGLVLSLDGVKLDEQLKKSSPSADVVEVEVKPAPAAIVVEAAAAPVVAAVSPVVPVVAVEVAVAPVEAPASAAVAVAVEVSAPVAVTEEPKQVEVAKSLPSEEKTATSAETEQKVEAAAATAPPAAPVSPPSPVLQAGSDFNLGDFMSLDFEYVSPPPKPFIPVAPPVPNGSMVQHKYKKAAKVVVASVVVEEVLSPEQLIQLEEEKKERAMLNYVTELKPFVFGEVSDFPKHHYHNEGKNAAVSRQFIRRVASEYSDLSRSLPLDRDSSVFMRIHEENTSMSQFMVAAPFGTPYGGGLFLFDMHLPNTYPSVPPKVNLQTTGHGAVRFNPNLYNCGKVCLSLLGTWQGQAGETWLANTSTILQLVVSIQSLIFVPQPYFNEPGYESSIGTPNGEQAADNYNKVIEAATLKWAVLDMMRNPPAGFEEVVKTHFYIRQDEIMKQCEEWLAKPGRAGLQVTVAEIKQEFRKLKKPASL